MIIPGWKSELLDKRKPKRIVCRNCKSSGSIVISIYSWYFHFWGFPFCPFNKKGSSICTICDETLKPKKMPHDLRLEYDNFKSKLKTPTWEYLGIFLLGIFIFWFIYEIEKDNLNEQKYLTHPEIGDTYEYKLNEGEFSTFKVIDLKQDSLFVINNKLNQTQKHKLSRIDKEDYYNNISYSISREDIKIMFEEEVIFGITRK